MEEKELSWWKRTPSLPCLMAKRKPIFLQVRFMKQDQRSIDAIAFGWNEWLQWTGL